MELSISIQIHKRLLETEYFGASLLENRNCAAADLQSTRNRIFQRKAS